MTTSEAVDELIGLLRTEDPLRDAPAAETLTRLQLAAADERFQAQRRRIAVLDHRAREFGLDRIESMDDLGVEASARTRGRLREPPANVLRHAQEKAVSLACHRGRTIQGPIPTQRPRSYMRDIRWSLRLPA